MEIAAKHIAKLREQGLFVANPKSPDHAYPDGVLVGKPKEVKGNSIPDFSTAYVLDLENDQQIHFDAPPVWFFGNAGVWVVLGQECSPVPGDGDFLDEWSSAEEAVEDILEFYFGNPSRMQAKATRRARLSDVSSK